MAVILCIFAHPDDESVACAGTIVQLVALGHHVVVVSATDGGAGELDHHELIATQGVYSVGELRRKELAAVGTLLGVQDLRILDFPDGSITNRDVWGRLQHSIIDLIEETCPDLVITFDHTGWYFHLDHVAVSIATTLAVQKAKWQAKAFLLSHFRVGSKWSYVFSDTLPVTHRVDTTKERQIKHDAYDLHASQELNEPRRQLEQSPIYEQFQLAFSSSVARSFLRSLGIFEEVTQI